MLKEICTGREAYQKKKLGVFSVGKGLATCSCTVCLDYCSICKDEYNNYDTEDKDLRQVMS